MLVYEKIDISEMESMLICLINQKSACSVIIGIF